jgi:3-dehydroquinate dehydratase-2
LKKLKKENKMKSILILNGPNLNLLGHREPEIYGTDTTDDIEKTCILKAIDLDVQITLSQSNIEGELVNIIQDARNKHDGIILNAGAYTHTSIAIMDAIIATQIPTVEVHISNIYRRESFRHVSYVGRAAIGQICGFGIMGYSLALEAITDHIS